jgi:hypothetical protein
MTIKSKVRANQTQAIHYSCNDQDYLSMAQKVLHYLCKKT